MRASYGTRGLSPYFVAFFELLRLLADLILRTGELQISMGKAVCLPLSNLFSYFHRKT